MANYANLKSDIAGVIRTNNNEEITGDILQEQLFNMVDELGAGYQYMGIAVPTTNPGSPDANVFYIASTAGTYTNFGGAVVADGEVAILKYNGSWTKEVSGAATAAQVTQLGQEVEDIFKDGTTPLGDYEPADFQIADEDDNILASFANGEVKTKKFNSKNAVTTADATISEADLNIDDESGNHIASFRDGGIFTKEFDSSEINKKVNWLIDGAPKEYGTGVYQGERIIVGKNWYNNSLWNTFTGVPMVQSFATYDDYIVFVYGAPNYGSGSLWRISTAEKLADLTFPHGAYNAPHGNVAGFSNTFASGNTDLPLLYVSQWDNEGGCFVYDIHTNGTCNLVQTIMTDGNMGDAFGTNLGDFVIDPLNGLLYSAKYKVGATHAEGNAMMFCKFKLPATSNSSVILTASDILDSFSILPNEADLTVTQDKVIDNGKMYIVCGYGSANNVAYPAMLYVINLVSHSVSSILNIDAIKSSEPEGLDVHDGGLLFGYGDKFVYRLTF